MGDYILTKSYSAVVKEGKIFLNEPTDLPEGTEIQLVEKISPHQLLTEQTTQSIGFQNQFDQFDLHKLIIQAIDGVGYTSPTLIQNQAIQPIMEKKDVLGIAKTGSGKTAAFALPILNNLLQLKLDPKKQPKVLIITPTRELAIQIGVGFDAYGWFTNLKQITIYGGVSQKPQVEQLRKGDCSILVATPGRLLDLMGQNFISLDYIQTLVLDEADRMLDMGFIPDIKRIIRKIPKGGQSLMFSATMPQKILDLAKSFLKEDFVHVTGDKQSIPINKIKQEIYFVEKEDKLELLHGLLANENISRALIFSRTKYGADKLARKLKKLSFSIDALHGNKSQQARQRVLSNFKANRTHNLVATDIAARGLDVDDISHVINYDLPSEPVTYLHRIGRTARAGKSGIAISFCANDQRKYFTMIEQLLGFHIPRALNNPFQSIHEEPLPTQLGKKKFDKTKDKSGGKIRKRSRKKRSQEFRNKNRKTNRKNV